MSLTSATLEVDLAALTDNYRLLKERLSGRTCAAVVKANAYGLGVAEVSRALSREACKHFFVATLDEALELRKQMSEIHIYVFNGIQPGEEKEFLAHRLIPVLNHMGQVDQWEKAAKGAPSALHADTGMTRLGLSASELGALAGDQLRVKRCGIQLLMSHLACANAPAHPKNAEQLARFSEATRHFPGIAASLANSAGIFLPSEYHHDMARPGCALYGINPIDGGNPMRHVATLSAPLLQVRTLEQNETVGYGATYEAPKGARIAMVALGYADGYFRMLGNKGFAYIAGHKVPIAGRVSMDMIALDISSVPENKLTPELRAEFINSVQTVNDVADACDTIGYEIFTRMGRRVKRLYL